MPLYCSQSNVEQIRMDDMEDAKNLGDIELVFPKEEYSREFMGVELGLSRGLLTEGAGNVNW